jgi:hypothetical protein
MTNIDQDPDLNDDEEVIMGLEDATGEDSIPGNQLPSFPHYEIHYLVFPPHTGSDRAGKFVETVNEAVARGGTVVQWMQTSVVGDPAFGGMTTQITAVVEFSDV